MTTFSLASWLLVYSLLPGLQSPPAAHPQPNFVRIQTMFFPLGNLYSRFRAGDEARRHWIESSTGFQLLVYNGRKRRSWQKRGGFALTHPLRLVVKGRMFQQYSAPVLTPSYFANFELRLFYLWRRPTRFSMLWGGVGLTHHSNGQSGCLYQGFAVSPYSGACVAQDTALAQKKLANTRDGNFGTNYLPIRLAFQHGAIQDGLLLWSLSARLSSEIHLFALTDGLAEQYGTFRLRLHAEAERRFLHSLFAQRFYGHLRAFAYFELILAHQSERFLYKTQLEVSYTIDQLDGFGVLLRVHHGQDPYNVRFQQHDWIIQLGLVIDLSRLDPFAPSPRPL